MACFRPKTVWFPIDGGRPHFSEPLCDCDGFIQGTLDCKECIGCQRKYSADWAARIVHESQCHEQNCFLTLTYRDEDLPHRGQLVPAHLRQFIKDLRNYYRGERSRLIRYFGVGEYGGRTWRPHYHLCGFGFMFDDLVGAGQSNTGHSRFTSRTLDSIWGRGNTMIGNLDPGTAAYTAGYCIKKLRDVASGGERYKRFDPLLQQWYRLVPEFSQKSTHPGIGRLFLDRFWSDVFPGDTVVTLTPHGAQERRAPEYYMRVLRERDEALYLDLKERRREAAFGSLRDRQPNRLADREVVMEGQQALKKRDWV